MIINIGLAFLEGLALIVSPCILPVLPLVLAASVEGGKRRPYDIIIGFVLAFSLFALVSRQIVLALGVDLDIIKRFRRYLLGSLCLMLSLTALPNATAAPAEETAVFAGGCFWGVDAVFKHVKGVSEVVSGYAGGSAATAHYERVSEGDTGHAEAVRVRFNPEQVSYQQLLQVFFSVAHDPTQLNRQGPDTGSQYRSAIFFTSDEQQKMAQGTIQQLTAARTFSRPIVTQVVPLQQFYPAEAYHQNYLALHPNQPYIVIHDKPKLEQLRKRFPALYIPTGSGR